MKVHIYALIWLPILFQEVYISPLIVSYIKWPMVWLIDLLIVWFIDWHNDHKLIVWVTYWLIDWLRYYWQIVRTDYEAHTFCNFSALDNVSGKRSIEENWKKRSIRITNFTILFYKWMYLYNFACLWISLGTKLLRSGKNCDTTLICYRKSFPKGEICKENVFL